MLWRMTGWKGKIKFGQQRWTVALHFDEKNKKISEWGERNVLWGIQNLIIAIKMDIKIN